MIQSSICTKNSLFRRIKNNDYGSRDCISIQARNSERSNRNHTVNKQSSEQGISFGIYCMYVLLACIISPNQLGRIERSFQYRVFFFVFGGISWSCLWYSTVLRSKSSGRLPRECQLVSVHQSL